jgi:hypothetical protein
MRKNIKQGRKVVTREERRRKRKRARNKQECKEIIQFLSI